MSFVVWPGCRIVNYALKVKLKASKVSVHQHVRTRCRVEAARARDLACVGLGRVALADRGSECVETRYVVCVDRIKERHLACMGIVRDQARVVTCEGDPTAIEVESILLWVEAGGHHEHDMVNLCGSVGELSNFWSVKEMSMMRGIMPS